VSRPATEREEHPQVQIIDNRKIDTMSGLDLTKRDMTVTYGNRSFALRAYRDNDAWHGVIIEDKTPVRNSLGPAPDAASCFAAAVHFVAAMIDTAGRPSLVER
jgi:hypothetical protein